MSAVLLVAAVFVACLVESVEALTVVLAVGLTRGWRSTLVGIGSALIVLAAIVAVLGPALTLIPLDALRIVVGGLLLVFGLQWLRKAILRAAGAKSLHDESAIFQRTQSSAAEAQTGAGRLDGYAVAIAFKGVLLEGLEVVFIVLTFGANQGRIGLAVAGAVAAVVLVSITGVILRAPLARVPENSLKYGVGILLISFGLFWGAEGVGAHWPGSDLAIIGLIATIAVTALALTAVARRRVRPAQIAPTPNQEVL